MGVQIAGARAPSGAAPARWAAEPREGLEHSVSTALHCVLAVPPQPRPLHAQILPSSTQSRPGDDDDGGAEGALVARPARKRAWEEDPAGQDPEAAAAAAELEAREAAREADKAAKEDFEARLREKDEARTRKLAEKKIPREELEDLQRRRAAEAAEDRSAVTGMLRWAGFGGRSKGERWLTGIVLASRQELLALRCQCGGGGPRGGSQGVLHVEAPSGRTGPGRSGALPLMWQSAVPPWSLVRCLVRSPTFPPHLHHSIRQGHVEAGVPEEAGGGQAPGAEGRAGGREVPLPGQEDDREGAAGPGIQGGGVSAGRGEEEAAG